MVFKIKEDEFGNPVRAKSRLVAKGFKQLPGIDYEETYAPVAGTNTQRIPLWFKTSRSRVEQDSHNTPQEFGFGTVKI